MKQVALYVRINKHLTSNLGTLWKVLPFRSRTGGVEPGMSSKGVKGNQEDNDQWIWPKREPTEEEKKELIGRMLEIGVRVMFRNLIYTFGGEHYLQEEGGPIGVRGTGAVSKLTTRDFCKKLRRILEEGGAVDRSVKALSS